MELRHLRYFAAVAHAGTYHAAAEQLHIAQPALWQQVRDLQTELGVTLFERAGRRVRLSRSGAALLEHAERVLAAAEKLHSTADDLRAGRTGVVAIACYTPHLERFLAPVIGRFEKTHPDIRIDVQEIGATGGEVGSIPASAAALMAGGVDLATGPSAPPGAEGFMVDESRIVAIIPPDHSWARRRSVPVVALQGEPLLLQASRDSFSRSAVEAACHQAGFEPTVKLTSQSSAALAALAANGVGVALLPDQVVPLDHRGLTRPIQGAGPLLRREVWLCWRTGALTSPPLQAFVGEARRHATSKKR